MGRSSFTRWATAQQPDPVFKLLEHEPATGSKFRRDAVTSGVPINLRYDQLSDEQKKYLKSQYEAMGDNDEPPYPENGLTRIMRELHAAQKILLVDGDLRLHINVDAQGKATSAVVVKSVDPSMDNYAAGVFLRAKYKPAMCKGVPCPQQYPFAMRFETEY